MKVAPEGYPFIAGSACIAAAAWFFGSFTAAALLFVVTAFMIFFFRDPERTIPAERGVFVSPADGKVIAAERIWDDRYRMRQSMLVSIFMSPFDVHVNRAPSGGSVVSVAHIPGRFLAAFKPEASFGNERIITVMEGEQGTVVLCQIAGFIARRAVCRVKSGDTLNRGDRYGIIKFSSRVDVYLPDGTDLCVKAGDRVLAGSSIIGKTKA